MKHRDYSGRNKYSNEVKTRAIESILSGHMKTAQAAKEFNINRHSLYAYVREAREKQEQLRIFAETGQDPTYIPDEFHGVQRKQDGRGYTKEFQQMVIDMALSGKYSQTKVAKQAQIDKSTLNTWLKNYEPTPVQTKVASKEHKPEQSFSQQPQIRSPFQLTVPQQPQAVAQSKAVISQQTSQPVVDTVHTNDAIIKELQQKLAEAERTIARLQEDNQLFREHISLLKKQIGSNSQV